FSLTVILLDFWFSPLIGAHRHLHSFPTRRSSDLSLAHGLLHGAPARGRHRRRRARARAPVCARHGAGARAIGALAARPAALAARSEEHTSELQSRENLVCRLLLDKKRYYLIALST